MGSAPSLRTLRRRVRAGGGAYLAGAKPLCVAGECHLLASGRHDRHSADTQTTLLAFVSTVPLLQALPTACAGYTLSELCKERLKGGHAASTHMPSEPL